VLTINRKDIRGIILLYFLAKIQEILGSACPVQDLFNIAFGISAGKYPSFPSFY
ncbi:hypothetical protein BO82DRAFT_298760, partial [Aspergillus uvarum CBS 121591]